MKKLIIINGATRGLGFAIVEQLYLYSDFKIICLVRNISSIGKLSQLLNNDNIFEIDLSRSLQLEEFESFLTSHFNHELEQFYFINNVSSIYPIGKIGSLLSQDIINSVSINITSNFLLVNSILKVLNGKKNINILNISSGIATNPLPGVSLYGIGKNYLDYLTQSLIIESNGNLKVSSFYPGSMTTEMRKEFLDELNCNMDLSSFDYSYLDNQTLSNPKSIASLIIKHFILGQTGWRKKISKFYDYE